MITVDTEVRFFVKRSGNIFAYFCRRRRLVEETKKVPKRTNFLTDPTAARSVFNEDIRWRTPSARSPDEKRDLVTHALSFTRTRREAKSATRVSGGGLLSDGEARCVRESALARVLGMPEGAYY